MTKRSLRPAAVAAIVAGAVGVPADAAWKQLSKPGDRQIVSADLSSLSRSGDVATLWARISPPLVQSTADYDASGQPIAQVAAVQDPVYLIQMACGARLVRVSTQGTATAQINPFAPEDMSPYTFQPLKNGATFALFSAMCPQSSIAPTYTRPDVTRIAPATPARTMTGRNPWKDRLTK